MAELIPIPFSNLLKRIYHEYSRTNSIFDLPSKKFYRPSPDLDLSVVFCGNTASNPSGPAAGPQTQLAQNIVLSWLAGGRIIELKTVQINDRLSLSRPCIDMATVGYNTEWSQELCLEESLREYVKASMIVEMLQRMFQVSGFKLPGEKLQLETSNLSAGGGSAYGGKLETIFDISVGYDLAGIQSLAIRSWLHTMRNATSVIEELRRQIPDEFAAYRQFPFKTEIGNSITLSTFHGTPADEIERICAFLLEELDFHVVIKMNPPMLGKERLELFLHEKLGYRDIEVSQHAFDVSITFSDAVDVVRRLEGVAGRCGKTIGVKFGNTLEVVNKGQFLKEGVQYLSGQPLHILHLTLVDEWRKVFGAGFPISFSAGVDAQNFADCVGTGMVPITTCTDLLRPGGYGRLQRYLYNLERRMTAAGASSINEFIIKTAQANFEFRVSNFELTTEQSEITNPQSLPERQARLSSLNEQAGEIDNRQSAILFNISHLLDKALVDPRYHAVQNRRPPRKIGRHLQLWDCVNCDKCIPVCPNDANFFFEVEPIDTQYKNIEIGQSGWRETTGGRFAVKESHQIGTFADTCNDCGNCDVFCPEDGGPYLEKPRFFGSVASWRRWKHLNGFVLCLEEGAKVLYGRFGEKEYRLAINREERLARFSANGTVVVVDWSSGIVLNATTEAPSPAVVDMNYYLTMATLLRGLLNPTRVNFVNIELQ